LVKVAVLGSPDLAFLDEFHTALLSDSVDALFDADVVLVMVSSLAAADQTLRDELVEWLSLPARQPLAIWLDGRVPDDSAARAVVGAADHLFRSVESEDTDRPGRGTFFEPGFDVIAYNPMGWEPATPDRVDDHEGLSVWSRGARPVIAAVDGEFSDRRRVVELMASGVPVVSSGSTAVRVRLGLPESAPPASVAAAAAGDVGFLARMSLSARRRSHRDYASYVRASAFLDVVGLSVPDRRPEVGALLITNKPHLLGAALEAILRQAHVSVFPVVGIHGDGHVFEEFGAAAAELLAGRPGAIMHFEPETTLGEALNRAATACSSPILAKFDDDDWYGPHYLEDALAALRYSGADLVGKGRYFVEIEQEGVTYLVDGPEESYSDHVIGSSMVFRRRLWEDVPFPHRPSRVDSIFLRGARIAGASIYSSSRFEFGVRRMADGHTWEVDPAHFAARGTRVGRMLVEVEVDVPDDLADGVI
jgi:hypothetical protein